ncbi:MAG: class I SAM-dependent RNA methyltransferase [Proteobacteria bacterium]|nr:class I SAM-dependent RNA methyltransferase [Pseudomonadota bacterium]
MIDWMKPATVLVTCPPGIPPHLAREVEGLGLPVTRQMDLGVSSEGTLTDCMRLCLHVRTGHRVLYELAQFKATDGEWLYRNTRKVAWEDILPLDGYFSVSSSLNTSAVDNSMFASLKVKDGVVDRIRNELGSRPDCGKESKGAAVFLHWERDRATLYLDCAGEPLARRGYRVSPHTAPMQETLSAAVVMASGYASGTFVNPMCGSGTLAIEAALIALDRAPGTLRKNFAFQHLKGYDPQVWQELLEEETLAHRDHPGGRIIATDIDPKAIEAAIRNAELAGVAEFIEFGVCDFRETEIPEEPGVVLLNPEYGKRLGNLNELEDIYSGIGDFFKQSCKGYTGGVFTGNLDLAKRVGLRTKKRIPFFNAQIECRLLTYELYAGTRKGA